MAVWSKKASCPLFNFCQVNSIEIHCICCALFTSLNGSKWKPCLCTGTIAHWKSFVPINQNQMRLKKALVLFLAIVWSLRWVWGCCLYSKWQTGSPRLLVFAKWRHWLLPHISVSHIGEQHKSPPLAYSQRENRLWLSLQGFVGN